MDRYGKRLLMVALLIGAAALCATLLQAGRSVRSTLTVQRLAAQEETAQIEETEPLAATEAPVEAVDLALIQPAEDAEEGFYVVLRTDPGRAVKLLSEEGGLLQRVYANDRGDATFSGLLPGQYRIESDRAGGSFLLLESAAVEAVSGTLWSDGELLHLENTPTVRLRVEFFIHEEDEGRIVTVRLTSKAGTDYTRSLVAGKPDFYAVEFACLKPGDYRLRINGRLRANLTVTSDPEQTFRLWTD